MFFNKYHMEFPRFDALEMRLVKEYMEFPRSDAFEIRLVKEYSTTATSEQYGAILQFIAFSYFV